jgi:hypothetical protein
VAVIRFGMTRERLKEFVPGGEKANGGARRLSSVLERALTDGAFRRSLARPAGAAWRLRTVDGSRRGSGRRSRGAGARGRSGMAIIARPSCGRTSAQPALAAKKGGRMPKALAGLAGLEHKTPRRWRCFRQSGAPDGFARPAQRILRPRTARGLRRRRDDRRQGHDADHLCDRIAKTGSEVVIPPKRNRTFKRPRRRVLQEAEHH